MRAPSVWTAGPSGILAGVPPPDVTVPDVDLVEPFNRPLVGVDADPDPFAALAQLLENAHSAAPVELPAAVRAAALRMGAQEVEILLIDWEQHRLLPLHLQSAPGLDPLPVVGTAAGRAFVSSAPVVTPATPDGVVVSTPLLDGIERLGVLQLQLPADGPTVQAHCRRFADLVTQFIATKGRCTDEYHRARQTRPMSLAAQLQWQMLPPLTAHAPNATVAGQLEPAYEVGGDAFDYAVNADRLHLGIFDAMGHGVPAAVTTALALGAYRHSRRHRRSLVETAEYIDAELAAEFRDDRYVTAMLGELELTTGGLTLVNAGHLQPLLLREGQVVRLPDVEPTLPLGLGLHPRPPVVLTTTRLHPRDRLLLLTDGILDAHDTAGTPFGQRRLQELIERSALDELPLAELARAISHGVYEYSQGTLRDDASLLLVEFFGPPGQRPPAGQAPHP